MRRIERESQGFMKPGQDLVVAGFAGLEGSKRIARARGEELGQWFSKAYIKQMQKYEKIAWNSNPNYWRELGATEWEMAGEGGIHTALWNLSGAYRTGFQIDLYRILVKQETIEICERYDLNPYNLYSNDCLVLVTDNGGHLAAELEKEQIPAAWIGVVKQGVAREIRYGQVLRFMDRPKEDELYKIIKRETV